MLDFNYQCDSRNGRGCGLQWYGYPYCRCPACCNQDIIVRHIEFLSLDDQERISRLKKITEEYKNEILLDDLKRSVVDRGSDKLEGSARRKA